MEYEMMHEGSNAVVLVTLQQGEKFKAESGAMVTKSETLSIRGHMWGGFFGAFKRSILGGETFFFQEVSAEKGAGNMVIAPPVPGDIKILPLLNGEDYYIQNGCMLAAFGDVNMDTKVQKLSAGLFSGAGFFVLHVKGHGEVAVSAFGAIMEIPIAAGKEYLVDNGHIVAWSGDLQYQIVKAGAGWISSFTSGEGLACKFTGPGKVWVQTRNPAAFGNWIKRFVPRSGGISIG